ncbi:MAG: hypothetical protein MUP58_00105 [Candidatus Nanohaloarchaeota archaeon QJJ-9]|nr:hypothetical protein [Candidatus Nanohaloarchaeota archaeon QJJ-9]
MHKEGQISIDYVGGAMIFFVSIVFVVQGIVGTIPQYSSIAESNREEIAAWGLSTSLVSDTGYWSDVYDGTNWEDNVITGKVKRIGLKSPEGSGVSREKINKLLGMDYKEIKKLFETGKDFSIEFTEYAVVKLSGEFYRGGDIDGIETYNGFKPPSDGLGGADRYMRYGTISINGSERYFLASFDDSDFDGLYVSDSIDFSSSEKLEQGELKTLDFNGRRFRFGLGSSGLSTSNGKILLVERVMGRIGRRIPTSEETVTRVKRYSNTQKSIIMLDMRVWK